MHYSNSEGARGYFRLIAQYRNTRSRLLRFRVAAKYSYIKLFERASSHTRLFEWRVNAASSRRKTTRPSFHLFVSSAFLSLSLFPLLPFASARSRLRPWLPKLENFLCTPIFNHRALLFNGNYFLSFSFPYYLRHFPPGPVISNLYRPRFSTRQTFLPSSVSRVLLGRGRTEPIVADRARVCPIVADRCRSYDI